MIQEQADWYIILKTKYLMESKSVFISFNQEYWNNCNVKVDLIWTYMLHPTHTVKILN